MTGVCYGERQLVKVLVVSEYSGHAVKGAFGFDLSYSLLLDDSELMTACRDADEHRVGTMLALVRNFGLYANIAGGRVEACVNKHGIHESCILYAI